MGRGRGRTKRTFEEFLAESMDHLRISKRFPQNKMFLKCISEDFELFELRFDQVRGRGKLDK